MNELVNAFNAYVANTRDRMKKAGVDPVEAALFERSITDAMNRLLTVGVKSPQEKPA